MISFNFLNIHEKIKIKSAAKEFIVNIVRAEQRIPGDFSVIFTDNNTLLDINSRFLHHEYFTDVITFFENKRNHVSGDIYISLDQVKLNAEDHFTDFCDEISRVLIHGILHIIGYDDRSPSEKKIMREKEDEYLCQFNWKDVIIDREAGI